MYHHCARGARLGAAAALSMILLGACAAPATAPVSDARPAPGTGESAQITQRLYDQLERWRGTRYRMGGLSREGVDCSGLAYIVYRDLFGRQLPRTTDEQGQVGQPVKRRALAPGDLVFFKTGIVQKHVGIYVEDGVFLHASRSSGVRLSRLDSKYWRERFWQARRVPVIQAGM
jgi:cell wall-associated NlpC family hydrolase